MSLRNLQTRKPLALLKKSERISMASFILLTISIYWQLDSLKLSGDWLRLTFMGVAGIQYFIGDDVKQNYSHSVEKIKGKLVTNTTANFVWKFGLLTLLSCSFPHTCDYVVYRAYHSDRTESRRAKSRDGNEFRHWSHVYWVYRKSQPRSILNCFCPQKKECRLIFCARHYSLGCARLLPLAPTS